ncbi:hypothetical protein TIFTF001_027542 [Ficus carica]|uniref:Uncharacterized protein n=1 Tax=Ficus carica TaxID=3494 RepID=A0AA88DN69_FICCA|nr:hypothetical protein TIFTF001_027542 [Ficus carica]
MTCKDHIHGMRSRWRVGRVEIAMMAAMRREGGYEAEREREREMLLSVDAHKCTRPKDEAQI